MGFNINEHQTNIVPFQSGSGIPNHLSPIGSVYVDNLTGIEYINKDGINTWAFLYDSSMSIGGGGSSSGGTVTGATIFTGGLTASTISAGTITATNYQNLPLDIRVTGGTYNNGTATFINNSGETFTVIGFTTPFTGGTVSGSTNFTNGLTANTISATTYYGDGGNLTNIISTKNGGIVSFSGLSMTSPSGTTFNVSPATGWIVDDVTNPLNPSSIFVNYSGQTGITGTYIGSASDTYILLSSGGTIVQQTTFPTPQERKQNLYLGNLGLPLYLLGLIL